MANKRIKSNFVRYPLGEKDYIIPIVYPDYMVAIPKEYQSYKGIHILDKKEPFGHAAVLLINQENGITKYYEYGRYDQFGALGGIQKVGVPNVQIIKGNVAQDSLKKVLKQISQNSGQNGRIESTIHRGDYYEKSLKWITNNATKYNKPNRKEYKIRNQNCISFVLDLLNHLDIDTHWAGFIIKPDEEMEELQEDFRDLRYNPKKDTLEIEKDKL